VRLCRRLYQKGAASTVNAAPRVHALESARLLAARRAVDADVRPILLDGLGADALDLAQLVDGLERAMLLAVLDDGLSAGETDPVELLGDRGRVGGIDVDGPRPSAERQETRDQQLHGSAYGVAMIDVRHSALLSYQ